MKPPQAYKILITDGTIHPSDPISFKIITTSSQKVLTPFTFANRNQYFNCQFLIFQSTKKIKLEVLSSVQMKPAQVLLDKSKQVVDILDKQGKNQGAITIQVMQIKSYPKSKFRFYVKEIKAEFTIGMAPKKEIFLIIKYGDKHFQTDSKQVDGIHCKWKDENQIQPQETILTLYIECWGSQDQYIGVSQIPIQKNINKETKHPLKDIKDIEIGVINIKLFDEEKIKEEMHRTSLQIQPIKIYVLEAVLNNEMKDKTHTYLNVEMEGSGNKLSTTSVFSNQRNPKWNQSFQLVVRDQDFIKFQLCQREDEEQQLLAVAKLSTKNLDNGKAQLSLELNQNQVGKLYIQLQTTSFKKEKEDYISPSSKNPNRHLEQKQQSQQSVAESQSERQSPVPKNRGGYKESQSSGIQKKMGNPQTIQKLREMKARYSGKTLYDYYNQELNQALRQGLLMIARQKPTDPTKQLGLFLINYKK